MAGRQARGPEADRLLTLERTGSETRALAGEDAVETTSSHPGSVLRLPPAWPLSCGADDVPAFCLVCFHREEEELEEVPLQRSVLGWAAGWQDHGAALPWAYRPAMMLMGPIRPLSPPPPPSHRAHWLSPQPSLHSFYSGPRSTCLFLHSHCGHFLSLLRDLHGSPAPTTEGQLSEFKACVFGVDTPSHSVPLCYQGYPDSPPPRPS